MNDLDILLGISGDPDITSEYQRAHNEDSIEAWRDYATFLEDVIINGVSELMSRKGLH
jgi:hypothetical protein